jgi:hypothetical protein
MSRRPKRERRRRAEEKRRVETDHSVQGKGNQLVEGNRVKVVASPTGFDHILGDDPRTIIRAA